MDSILDTSALLAFLLKEQGQDLVADEISAGAGICTGNVAEVVTVLVRGGMPVEEARRVGSGLPVTFFDVDLDLAVRAGAMIGQTRPFGLSLGDRLCLALAARESVPAIAADSIWLKVGPAIGVSVKLIR